MFNFNRFHLLNLDFGPVVVFLDCSLHRGHHAFNKMRWSDDCGPVREGPDPSTGLGSGHPAFFFTYAPKIISKAEADPDVDARSIVWCCAGIAPFYGTGARAEARIRTSVPDPRLILQTAYRTV
jgi:hypothetical protein